MVIEIDNRCYINWHHILTDYVIISNSDELSFMCEIINRFDERRSSDKYCKLLPDNGLSLYRDVFSAATNVFAYAALQLLVDTIDYSNRHSIPYYSYLWKNALLIKAGYQGAFDGNDIKLIDEGIAAFELPKDANKEDKTLWKLMMKYEKLINLLENHWENELVIQTSLLNKCLKLKNKITKKLYKLLLNNQPVSIYKE